MPLQKLQFRPGVNREGTTLSNEGGWFESEKARWRSGYPEKIGGWTLDTGMANSTLTPASTPVTLSIASPCVVTLPYTVPNGTAIRLTTTGALPTGLVVNTTYYVINLTTTVVSTNYTLVTCQLSQTLDGTAINTSGSQSGTQTLTLFPGPAFWGVPRAIWNWLNLAGSNLVAVGTSLKYYIQNSPNASFNDVTPARTTSTVIGNPVTFNAVNGSNTIVVTNIGHGLQTGDFVIFASAASLGGNITATVLNAEFEATFLTANTFSIQTYVAANSSDTGTGGGATVATYLVTSGSATFTTGAGWGVGGWSGYTPSVPATTLNGAINSSVTSVTVTSTSGFTTTGAVLIDTEWITYTGITTNTLTGCTRGAYSTVAASHSTGVGVVLGTGWGSAAYVNNTGQEIGQQLRLWSQSNYGEDLVFNPRNGAMYYWANNANPNIFDRGQIVKAGTAVTTKSGSFTPDSTCPSIVNFVMVSDASRFVFAFGCNDPTGVYATTVQDPMQIRWSDQNSLATWTPAITNQAGGIRLSHGSTIVSAIQTRQEILVLTDAAVYSLQYLGAPYVWSTQLLGDNISIVGPNAMSTVNNVTYWMGADKFYMYSGRVETLPCALRQYIYDNINMNQAYQFFSGTNEGYNEVWWFYCSETGPDDENNNTTNQNTTVDRYVIYNHLERTWYYGTMKRTAWCDSPLRVQPMSASYANTTNGRLIYQETGVDDNETGTPVPIESWVQSSDFDIGDGHNMGFVWRMIPDLTFDGSTVDAPSADFTVRPRQNPGADYGSSDNRNVESTENFTNQRQYNVQQFTQQIYVRIRGRQMAFKVSSNTLGVQWQLGSPRIDVRPDGRR
jgi:hypothetical protein